MLITCRLRFTMQAKTAVRRLTYARWDSQSAARPESMVVRVNLPTLPKIQAQKTIQQFAHRYDRDDIEAQHEQISKSLRDQFIPSLGFSIQEELYPSIVHQPPAAFMIENLFVDTYLPPSPSTDYSPDNKSSMTEMALLGAVSITGHVPYLLSAEKNNSIIQNIVPQPSSATEASSRGFKVSFPWHTENGHEASPPDALVLFCLRGDPNAATNLLFIDDVIDILPERIVKALMSPDFVVKTGPTFHKVEQYFGSILDEDEREGLIIRYNSSDTRLFATNPDAQVALDDFRKCVEEVAKTRQQRVVLEAGNFLFFNNRKILHAREPFEISTSYGERRWLQRAYLRKESPGVFDTRFYSCSKLDKDGDTSHEYKPTQRLRLASK